MLLVRTSVFLGARNRRKNRGIFDFVAESQILLQNCKNVHFRAANRGIFLYQGNFSKIYRSSDDKRVVLSYYHPNMNASKINSRSHGTCVITPRGYLD